MQISDLLQLQAAARGGQPAPTPVADAGRAPAAGAAAAAVEGFASQLRRAIQRQASAAGDDAPPARRPEPAVGPGELGGLEPLDAALTDVDVDAGAHADAPGVGLPVHQAPAASAALPLDATLAAAATTEGSVPGRVGPAFLEATAAGADVPRAPGTPGVGAAPDPRAGPAARADRPLVDGRPGLASVPRGPSAEVAPGAALPAPAAAVGTMPSTTDFLRAAAVRGVPSAASGAVSGSSEAAAGASERLHASAQAPAMALHAARGEAAAGTGLPERSDSARRQGPGAGRLDAPSGTDVRATPPGALAMTRAAGAAPGPDGLLPPEGPAQRPAASRATDRGAAAVGRGTSAVAWPMPAAVIQTSQEPLPTGLGLEPPVPARAQVPLRTAALGPGVDLVVGDEPEPGIEALLTYARDSGFGAQALKKLFGADAGAAAGPVPAATSAPATLAARATDWPAAPVAALPAAPMPSAGDPAVLSMAAWIGARAGPSATGGRSSPASPVGAVGPVSDRVDLAGASPMRAAGPEASSSGPWAAAVPPAASAGGVPPAPVWPSMVTVPPGTAPVSHADLALRLAQATATRMVAELRQGNGSLRLQIEPASLGKVDIDMTLRQGALEATLVAHHAVTRELLVDGLPRLRDTLMQLGMNVAGVDIKSGLSGQGDGKSTNQQNKEIWYSARRASAVDPTLPVDGGDQRRSSRLDLWA